MTPFGQLNTSLGCPGHKEYVQVQVSYMWAPDVIPPGTVNFPAASKKMPPDAALSLSIAPLELAVTCTHLRPPPEPQMAPGVGV